MSLGRSGLHALLRTDAWAVLAKPSGLACHRSAMVSDRDTVIRRARRRFGDPVHLVHRLDRAASGCLIVAFDGPTTGKLAHALGAAEATKTYLALVRGYVRWDDPVGVDAPIKLDDGRLAPARTVVTVLGRSHSPRCSLVVARPETGRHHQVRRHLRDLGHPILGDTKHGDARENHAWRDTHGLDRLQLHAWSVEVPTAPGGPLSVACPLAHDLHALWRQLPWWADAVGRDPRLDLPALHLRVGARASG